MNRAPNPRMQRTPSAPLMRKPLGGQTVSVATVALLATALSVLAQDSPAVLSLRLESPVQVRVGQPFGIRFTVTNEGKSGVYFKQPWKWASNGMRIVATGPDGSIHESSVALFDIEAKYRCTYFKPLGPADSFTFQVFLGSAAPGPALSLSPGRYRLRWVYEPKIYPDEKSCTAAGWPIWSVHVESPAVDLDVVE